MNSETDTHIFDQFCDYTSISGFRFLHKRHPLWFRIISAIILFSSIGMFFHHSSQFVKKYYLKENRFQLSTTKAESIKIPSIVICPLRQFRSLIAYNGTMDFMHVVSHDYKLPNMEPYIKKAFVSWSNYKKPYTMGTLSDLLDNALNKVEGIRNTSWPDRVNKSMEFYNEFFNILPETSLLINLYFPILYAVSREKVYESYNNFDGYISQAKNVTPDCFRDHFPSANFQPITYDKYENFDYKLQQQLRERNNSDLTAFSECRMNKVIGLLAQYRKEMEMFPEFALKTQRTLQETILWCRWLDGGNCVYEEVSSDMGVKCFKVSGESKINASYITLKSSIQILVDLFAFDNQVDYWRGKEAQIFTLNDQNKMVYSHYDAYNLIAGRHVDLNVASDASEQFKFLQDTSNSANNSVFGGSLESTYPQYHPRQRITYKIDQGYSRVRLFNYKVSKELQSEKQSQRDVLSKKVQEMGNSAFLPKVHSDLFVIVVHFFAYHVELLKRFDRNMEHIMNRSLSSTLPTNYCSETPSLGFALTERQLLELISSFWISETENLKNLETNLPNTIFSKQHVSPVQLIDYYRKEKNIQNLIQYLNNIFDTLNSGETSNMVRRLSYDTSENVLVQDLRRVINKSAARSQFGDYEKNNFASIQFRFRSMTKMEITDSTKYKLFNLLVDMGSTLGLYFGMTVLTLFELAIFVFYRDESKIQMQRVPPQSVIYNLPRNPKKKPHQRKTTNIQRLYNTEANSIMPTIF